MERFEFKEKDFRYISEMVTDYAGITLTRAKKELIYGRLTKRLRARNLASFSDYCDILRSGDKEEFRLCVNAITTNMTSFFRENHHFEFLDKTVIPQLIRNAQGKPMKRLRVWSAGCSTGEEPYSIAMTIKEHQSALTGWEIQIVATDLDSEVLRKAELGIYPLECLENMSIQRRKNWFRKGIRENEGMVKLVPEIPQMVTFERLNLAEPWSWNSKFDLVFCRNVMIYFSKEIRQSLLRGFAGALLPDGYLMVGHSESLSGLTDAFTPVGQTIYRKLA